MARSTGALAPAAPGTAPAPDLVNRNFEPPRADQIWAADVTQFPTGSAGDCYDHSAVEAVWATLKRELARIHGAKTWDA